MRIALVTDGIWPYVVGGMQRHSYCLCKYLARSGINVDLYYTVKNKDFQTNLSDIFTAEELQNIEPYLIEYPTGVYFPGHYMWKSYHYSRLIYQQLYKRLKQYDIVYIQGFSGWYLLKKRMQLNISTPPCIVNLHGLEMFQRPSSIKSRLEQYLFKPFARRQLLMADYVQSLGGALTSILLSIGVNRSNIIECPNAIERKWLTEKILSNPLPRRFAFIGRYERRKGIEELNIVLRRLISEEMDFEMHFIGPIPDSYQIKDQKIFYYGQVSKENEIKSVLDKIDYLVVPSLAEGMPTVILEAMARGCAIIASNVGAIPEMVSDNNGILMEHTGIQVLYDSMVKGLRMNDDHLVEWQRSSLRRVEELFLWEKVITSMKLMFSKFERNNDLIPC